jgi:hypothetical protein
MTNKQPLLGILILFLIYLHLSLLFRPYNLLTYYYSLARLTYLPLSLASL